MPDFNLEQQRTLILANAFSAISDPQHIVVHSAEDAAGAMSEYIFLHIVIESDHPDVKRVRSMAALCQPWTVTAESETENNRPPLPASMADLILATQSLCPAQDIADALGFFRTSFSAVFPELDLEFVPRERLTADGNEINAALRAIFAPILPRKYSPDGEPGAPSRLAAAFPAYGWDSHPDGFVIITGPDEGRGPLLPEYARQLFRCLRNRREFTKLASHDSMTGLLNHDLLYSFMNKLWQSGGENQIGLIIMDIDNFKNFNDSYGHQIGDTLIRETGRIINDGHPQKMKFFRYGGDEFAILIPETNPMETAETAALILKKIRSHAFGDSFLSLHITASLGYATVHPNENSPEEMMEMADKALFAAKRGGRNQTFGFTEKMKTPARRAAITPHPAKTETDGNSIGAKILIVDDEEMITTLLSKTLTNIGADVMTANNARNALSIIRQAPDNIDIVITDINMPGMDGIGLIQHIHDINPNVVNIIITGFPSAENNLAALRAGAYDIIIKPFKSSDISIIIDRAVEKRRLQRQLDAYHSRIEELLNDKTQALYKALESLKQSYVNTIKAIATMLDAHESSVASHSSRVGEMAIILAKEMGVNDGRELESIRYGAMMHDIGKIGVPGDILNKPGKLDQRETELIRRHPELGHQILANIPIIADAADTVLQHHERFDGKGYPAGLAGEQICLGARIFSVIDSFDAIRSDRKYQPSLDLERAMLEINQNSGTQFDPAVVAAFNRCYRKINEIFEKSLRQSSDRA